MTIREQVVQVIREDPTEHERMLRGAEAVLAEQGTKRALTDDEVGRYRLHAKIEKLNEAVVLLASAIDRLATER